MAASSMSMPLAPQSYVVPFAGGGFLGVNTVGTAAAQVIAADQSRTSITFVNPNVASNVGVAVMPVADINGNSLLGTTYDQGGCVPILPGALVTFTGDSAKLAWAAVAQTGSDNGLTVIPSRT